MLMSIYFFFIWKKVHIIEIFKIKIRRYRKKLKYRERQKVKERKRIENKRIDERIDKNMKKNIQDYKRKKKL